MARRRTGRAAANAAGAGAGAPIGPEIAAVPIRLSWTSASSRARSPVEQLERRPLRERSAEQSRERASHASVAPQQMGVDPRVLEDREQLARQRRPLEGVEERREIGGRFA